MELFCLSNFYIELHYLSIRSIWHRDERDVLSRRNANQLNSTILNSFGNLGRLSNKNVVLFLGSLDFCIFLELY